jgi:phospholipid/cholesterol/gamma-HCH transport system ATP-binding protein
MPEEPIIKVEELKIQYGSRVILDHINFNVKQGEVFVILGGSGCGKTTLLRHMIGLEQPVSGQVYLDHKDIVTAEGDERDYILRHIGVMFQSGALFGSMSLLENVCLPLEELTELPSDAIDAIALNKLKLVGLGDFPQFLPAEISGGMQKRAAIARALALDPKMIFLDEPSAGLDPITSASLDQLILELSNTLGMTFVVVTHELPSIFTIADRVIMLDDGKIVAEGRPEDIKKHSKNPFVHQFFNREATA